MLTEQAVVLRRVEQLVAGEDWRADRRAAWTAILRGLVLGMSWTTGLVTGVTAATLAAGGGRSERTVSDVIRWAKDSGLLVTVEEGAAASFLGSKVNRCPSYVFLDAPGTSAVTTDLADQGSEELCDLPFSSACSKPLQGSGRRLEKPHEPEWPLWRVPETPAQRSAAVRRLSGRIGLDRAGVSRWRVLPALKRWFEAGWCVAGLLHAIDHHPDQPIHQGRGDALRGGRDPVRVLLYRLKPWDGRLGDLPGYLHGRSGDYQLEQARRLAERLAENSHARAGDRPSAAPADTSQVANSGVQTGQEHHRRLAQARAELTNQGTAPAPAAIPTTPPARGATPYERALARVRSERGPGRRRRRTN